MLTHCYSGLVFIVLIFMVRSCQDKKNEAVKHIFYLHGRIIELHGKDAVSPLYGKYHFDDIVSTLSNNKNIVYAPIRTGGTDFIIFAEQTSNQIDSLLQAGVSARNISVIGASKGGIIAMYISHINPHPINYILLGANTEVIELEYDWQLHGRVLACIEESGQVANRSYNYWKARSPNLKELKEIKLTTGLGHGFLYKPLPEWVTPTKAWIEK